MNWMSYLWALPVVVIIIVIVIGAVVFGFAVAQNILNTQNTNTVSYTTGNNIMQTTGVYLSTYIPLIVLALLGGFALAVFVVVLIVAVEAAQKMQHRGSR